jgi:AcrR family transcriptional regulator
MAHTDQTPIDTIAAYGRPYHHGDLSRALILAGRRILEREGPAALSLRAVAREAGVSPAAPYHHFKDKGELLDAVAMEGWRELGSAIGQARAEASHPRAALNNIGVAYVVFATAHPALYRIMYDSACDKADMPQTNGDEVTGWGHVRAALIEAGADPEDERELQVATIAAWCAAHGVAEMVAFKEFEPLKKALGGDVPFIRAVLGHVRLFDYHPRVPPLA